MIDQQSMDIPQFPENSLMITNIIDTINLMMIVTLQTIWFCLGLFSLKVGVKKLWHALLSAKHAG